MISQNTSAFQAFVTLPDKEKLLGDYRFLKLLAYDMAIESVANSGDIAGTVLGEATKLYNWLIQPHQQQDS